VGCILTPLCGWELVLGKVHFHVPGSGQECPLYTICGGLFFRRRSARAID